MFTYDPNVIYLLTYFLKLSYRTVAIIGNNIHLQMPFFLYLKHELYILQGNYDLKHVSYKSRMNQGKESRTTMVTFCKQTKPER